MSKAYFTPEVFQFLAQLKRNNKRDWFLKNKARYETLAKQPSLNFITDFQFRLRAVSPWINPMTWAIAALAIWAARGSVTVGLWASADCTSAFSAGDWKASHQAAEMSWPSTRCCGT